MPKKKAYKALLHKCGGLLVVAKYLHFLAKPPCIALLVAWQGDGSGPTRAFLSLLVVKQDLQPGLAWSGQHQHSQCDIDQASVFLKKNDNSSNLN